MERQGRRACPSSITRWTSRLAWGRGHQSIDVERFLKKRGIAPTAMIGIGRRAAARPDHDGRMCVRAQFVEPHVGRRRRVGKGCAEHEVEGARATTAQVGIGLVRRNGACDGVAFVPGGAGAATMSTRQPRRMSYAGILSSPPRWTRTARLRWGYSAPRRSRHPRYLPPPSLSTRTTMLSTRTTMPLCAFTPSYRCLPRCHPGDAH